jgi:DnaJ-class molecular chaperone
MRIIANNNFLFFLGLLCAEKRRINAEKRRKHMEVPKMPEEMKVIDCPECEGQGKKNGADCPACEGSGKVSAAYCPTCGGKGMVELEPCSMCDGTGHIPGMD